MGAMRALLLVASAITATSARGLGGGGCYIAPDPKPTAHTRDPTSESAALPQDSLPVAWDWRDVNGTDFTSPIRSQYVPQWCGSCWAHGVVSSLSDRIAIGRRRDRSLGTNRGSVLLSVQNLLDCGWDNAQGDTGSCNGGSWERAVEFARREGLAEESCSPYLAADRNCIGGNRMCTLCWHNGTCVPVPGARHFKVDEWGCVHPPVGNSACSADSALFTLIDVYHSLEEKRRPAESRHPPRTHPATGTSTARSSMAAGTANRRGWQPCKPRSSSVVRSSALCRRRMMPAPSTTRRIRTAVGRSHRCGAAIPWREDE